MVFALLTLGFKWGGFGENHGLFRLFIKTIKWQDLKKNKYLTLFQAAERIPNKKYTFEFL